MASLKSELDNIYDNFNYDNNMLSLSLFIDKLKTLDNLEDRKYDTVYVYDEKSDEYFNIHNVRIDSENDIVIDIKRE